LFPEEGSIDYNLAVDRKQNCISFIYKKGLAAAVKIVSTVRRIVTALEQVTSLQLQTVGHVT
jgi:hypothetical protein